MSTLPVQAQSTGRVTGVVKDASGAVIAGVHLRLTNNSTQQSSEATSTSSGSYSFVFITPGTYTLKVNQTGFAEFARENIPVDIAAAVTIDINLQVGTVSESLDVTSQVPDLQTSDTSLSHVVDNIMMNAVPLSSRNFTQVLALSPGVTANVIDAGAIGRNSVNISANGARPWDNNFVMNGMDADNPMSQGFDDAPDKTGVPVPSPDAIEEFKVQTGLYDAEYGKEGGGTVNIVTKSGTNQFHGSAFEFFRNTALDANSFFENASGAAKPIFRQNQYGGTVGGPIKKDKLFFFVSYQGTDQANGVSSSSNQTTFLPLLGDRSAAALGSLYGGQSGIFGGVAIAPNGSNINPSALALLNAKLPNGQYAIPNPCVLTGATVGYCALSSPAIFHEKQIISDVDYSITQQQRLSLKTLYSRDPESLPFQASTNVLGFGESDYHANTNIALSYTYTITPTLVNELRAGYQRNLVNQQPVEPLTSAELGMTPANPQVAGMASILVNGLFNVGTNRNNDQLVRIQQAELGDTLSKSLGRHQLRLGASVEPTRVKYSDLFVQRGEIYIQSFPDFLLGMTGAENGTPYSNLYQTLAGDGRPSTYPATNNFSLFAQDDFRLSDQITLNLGMRYQFNGQPYYSDGQMSNWDYRLYPKGIPPAGGTLQGLVLPNNVPSYITIPAGVTKLSTNTLVDHENWLGFSPRVGIAWRPMKNNQNLVVRVGYGLFWSAVAGTYSIGTSAGEPFYDSVVAGGANNANVSLQHPFGALPAASSFPIYQPVSLGSNPTTYPYDPEMVQPRTQNYSGNVQWEFKRTAFQVGYVGSQTTNIVGFVAPNEAGLASAANPINGQTTNTVENLLLRVPYVGFSPSIDSVGEFMNTYCQSEQACSSSPYTGKPYWSRYNSFQFSANRRFSNGLSFSLAYTWSRDIDNIDAGTSGRQMSLGTTTGDYHNPQTGLSNFNRENVLTASYLWNVPKWKSAQKLANTFVNGWSLSGVVIVESGLPYSITDGRDGTVFGADMGGFAQFASGAGPTSVAISSPTLNHYFNTSVFAPPPVIGDGTGFGNSPRNFLTGPGFWNTDLAVLKDFTIREPAKVQFRAEFFNLFNHANFANPGSDLSAPSNLGVISNTVSSPRIIQVALHLQF